MRIAQIGLNAVLPAPSPSTYLDTFSGPPAASFKTCCAKTSTVGGSGRRPAGCDGKVGRAAAGGGNFPDILLGGVYLFALVWGSSRQCLVPFYCSIVRLECG
jgi:hypothetical protein